MPSIFISYSRKDLSIAQQLEQTLQENGHAVWRDQESLYGGQQWPKTIGEAIAANNFFVIVWSRHAAQSHFVEFEWTTALALKKIIVPCLFDDTPLPPSLRAINGISFQNFANGILPLLKSLQQPLPAVETAQQANIMAKLQTLKSAKPEKVVAEAKTIFAQQGWSVQGNVYQAARDVHVTIAPPIEKHEKKLLERWQTWVGLIGGVLAILAAVTELPEKVVKMYNVLAANSKPDSTQMPAERQTLRGQIKDEAGLPLAGVRVVLPEFDQSDTTDANGVFELNVYAPVQARVRLQAYIQGYQPLNRDPSWGEQLNQYKMVRSK